MTTEENGSVDVCLKEQRSLQLFRDVIVFSHFENVNRHLKLEQVLVWLQGKQNVLFERQKNKVEEGKVEMTTQMENATAGLEGFQIYSKKKFIHIVLSYVRQQVEVFILPSDQDSQDESKVSSQSSTYNSNFPPLSGGTSPMETTPEISSLRSEELEILAELYSWILMNTQKVSLSSELRLLVSLLAISQHKTSKGPVPGTF